MRTWCAVLTAGFVILLSLEARADVVVSGSTSNAGTYSTTALAGLATAATTFSSGGLTGISVWGLLGGQGASSQTALAHAKAHANHRSSPLRT